MSVPNIYSFPALRVQVKQWYNGGMAGKTILTFCLLTFTGPTWAEGLAAIEKSCLGNKKSKAFCACLERNISKRVKDLDLGEDQVKMLADLAGGRSPASDSEKPDGFDAMADYFAGLEFHCQENPKYSAP